MIILHFFHIFNKNYDSESGTTIQRTQPMAGFLLFYDRTLHRTPFDYSPHSGSPLRGQRDKRAVQRLRRQSESGHQIHSNGPPRRSVFAFQARSNQHLFNPLTRPNSINFNPHHVHCEGTTEGELTPPRQVLQPQAFSAADFHPPVAADDAIQVQLRPEQRIYLLIIKMASEMPIFRQTSPTQMPVSACFSANAICSSV